MGRSRTFCCCIPVRLGVFIMTLLACIACSFGVYAGATQIISQKSAGVADNDLIALYIVTGIYGFAALISLFGFIGAIVEVYSFVRTYAYLLLLHLLLHIGFGVYNLRRLFQTNQDAQIQQCAARANAAVGANSNVVSTDACAAAFKVSRGLAVGAFVLVTLLEFWIFSIAWDYSKQLREDEFFKRESYNNSYRGAPPSVVERGPLLGASHPGNGYKQLQ